MASSDADKARVLSVRHTLWTNLSRASVGVLTAVIAQENNITLNVAHAHLKWLQTHSHVYGESHLRDGKIQKKWFATDKEPPATFETGVPVAELKRQQLSAMEALADYFGLVPHLVHKSVNIVGVRFCGKMGMDKLSPVYSIVDDLDLEPEDDAATGPHRMDTKNKILTEHRVLEVVSRINLETFHGRRPSN